MRNRYTAMVRRDGKWWVAICPEIPEANGQGKTREECLESLASAIELVLEYKRERALENVPKGTEQTAILVRRDETSRFVATSAGARVSPRT